MARIETYPKDQELTGKEKVLSTDIDGSTINIEIDQIVNYRPTEDVNDGSVTNTKLADAPADTLKGRLDTDGTPEDLNPSQVRNLLNIQDGATDDQTPAEIKTAYESNPDTNEFSDAEKAKLAALDDSKYLGTYTSLGALNSAHPSPTEGSYAHVDLGVGEDVSVYIWDNDDNQFVQQVGSGTSETPASIKSKYESNANTNTFTDLEKSKLSGIEVLATADQTPAEIKTAYESNSNTNAFTDTDKSKLDNIEANAKDDQNASEVPTTFSPTNYTATGSNVRGHLEGLDSALGNVGGGGGDTYNLNNTYADYTGSGLIGVQDGSNTQFVVSEGEYATDTLMVALNGQVFHNGTGVIESNPASGVFNFETAPETSDVIYVRYQVGSTGGSGTDDQTALEVPTAIQNGVTQANVQLELEKLNINTRPFDLTPTTSSSNAVESGGVKAALVNINSHVADGNIDVAKINNFDSEVASTPAVSANSAKVGITAQQASDIQANSSKVSNATHTGDVTGSTVLTINNNVVTNSKLANMSLNTIKGRATSGTGDPEDLSASQVRAITQTETSSQLDTRDTNNRNRSNHTGTQAISTVSGLQTALDGKAATNHTHPEYLSSTSDDTTSGKITAAAFGTGNWEIDQDGSGNLEFRYNGTPVFQMKTDGILEASNTFKQGLT